MNNQQHAELDRLERVLAVARRNGNELFIQNIEREIEAVQRGESSPLIKEYLTEEERASRGVENQTRLQATDRHAIPTIDRSGSQGNAP